MRWTAALVLVLAVGAHAQEHKPPDGWIALPDPILASPEIDFSKYKHELDTSYVRLDAITGYWRCPWAANDPNGLQVTCYTIVGASAPGQTSMSLDELRDAIQADQGKRK